MDQYADESASKRMGQMM